MHGILLVMSEPTEGAEAGYHAWYDGVHLPDVLAVPGFVAARRYVAVPSVKGELPERRYLAVYEIEADDLAAAQAALSAAAGGMEISPALDRASTVTFTYQLLVDGEPG